MSSIYLRFCLIVALVPLAASAGAVELAQARKPTGAERSSFAGFFHGAYPDAGTAPSLSVRRGAGERRWDVESEEFELRPARAGAALCASEAVRFRRDGHWHESSRRQLVWLDGPSCASPGGRVARAAGMTDGAVTRILQRQQALLARARLVMAGNSDCAKERSSRFSLAAIVSQVGNRIDLEFHSDRPVVLTVGALAAGADFDVLDVHCAY